MFLGNNGTGKSSVFEVLWKLRELIANGVSIDTLFDYSDCTIWQTSSIQTFELEIEGNGGRYRYELAVNHDQFSRSTKINVIKIIPSLIKDDGDAEMVILRFYAENYVSWYRYLSEDQGKAVELINALKEVFEDFAYFKFEYSGKSSRSLKVCFKGESKNLEYKLSQLSDGQKVLIVLYTLITCLKDEDCIICIDEPENFLALAEIQPWLMQLYDLCQENQLQAFLISHHPEFINFASSVGYWFERPNNHTPVRVKPLSEKLQAKNFQDPSLSISELIARGWLDE